MIVEDTMTRQRHTVTEITDTPSGRYYWIDGKSYEASRFSNLVG